MISSVVHQVSQLSTTILCFYNDIILFNSDCIIVFPHKAVLRPESTPGEMPGVNDDLLEDVDIEEQFLIHGTLLDDIRPQAAQVLQLEQYSSDLVGSCWIDV